MPVKAAIQNAPTDSAVQVPIHLGLILDGNRRWAKERGLPTFDGHREGYQNLKKICSAALERGVKYVSAFVFSTENWKRSREEVNYLMKLLHWVATKEVDEMNRKNIRVRFLGSESGLTSKVVKAIRSAEEKTKDNTGGTLALCLNYGGQQEIADAVKDILKEGIKAEDITPQVIADHLYGSDIPPVDLVIRSSGEQRISGFMLWRMAYAELKFVDTYWPAFSEAQLDECLADYAARQRRFGK
jgi:undecaprenyl diphosphate synthase